LSNIQFKAPREVELPETPTRVILVGNQWDSIGPALMALANQSGMVFIGPAGENLEEIASHTAPSVIMISPDSEYASLIALKNSAAKQPSFPPTLLCITQEALERDDSYEDMDDILLVPCSAAELRKRIKRLARRSWASAPSLALEVGKITLNLSTYQVMMEGRQVNLAWMEFQLLKFLMQNPGRVFTREQLLVEVWGVDSFGGTRTVDVHIRRLRSKLGVHGDKYFRTVKNVGYGMVCPL
jgi:DNA-binding response OmpR family regulator